MFVSLGQDKQRADDKQIRLASQIVLNESEEDWLWHWHWKETGADKGEYLLVGKKKTEEDKKAEQVARYKERTKRLRRLLEMSPQELSEERKYNPDEVIDLQSPKVNSMSKLFSSFSDADLERVFGGETLTYPVRNLSSAQQDLVRQSIGRLVRVSVSVTGERRRTSSPEMVMSGGVVQLFTESRTNAPRVLIKASPTSTGGTTWAPLNPNTFYPETAKERAQAAERIARRKQHKIDAALGKNEKLVTIERDTATTDEEEPILSAYLRSLSNQSHLAVVAVWDKTDKKYRKPLPRSIRRKTAGEALNILCSHFDCEWLYENDVVKIVPRDKARL